MAKAVRVSQDILPLGEFKTHASKVLRRLHERNRVIVITQNGKPAAVLITPEEFDRLNEREQFVEAVQEGLQDSEAGRVTDDSTVREELNDEFGAPDRR